MLFHFPDVSMAFMFYNWYASTKGFTGRRDRVVKDCRGEIISVKGKPSLNLGVVVMQDVRFMWI